MANINEITINQSVAFESKNNTDDVTWRGKVVGAGVNYNIASAFGDIISYHSSVSKIDPEIGDKETLEYFLINLEGEDSTRVFAKEWIEPGSLVVLSEGTITNLKIWHIPENELAEIMDSIRLRGYYVEKNIVT